MITIIAQQYKGKHNCAHSTWGRKNVTVSCQEYLEYIAVSYTHLTLPTNREV